VLLQALSRRHAATARVRVIAQVDWLDAAFDVIVDATVYNHAPLVVMMSLLTRQVVSLGFPDQRPVPSPENHYRTIFNTFNTTIDAIRPVKHSAPPSEHNTTRVNTLTVGEISHHNKRENGRGERSSTCYCVSYTSQTRGQKRFTISAVTVDWHELLIPQRTMRLSIARVSERCQSLTGIING